MSNTIRCTGYNKECATGSECMHRLPHKHNDLCNTLCPFKKDAECIPMTFHVGETFDIRGSNIVIDTINDPRMTISLTISQFIHLINHG